VFTVAVGSIKEFSF